MGEYSVKRTLEGKPQKLQSSVFPSLPSPSGLGFWAVPVVGSTWSQHARVRGQFVGQVLLCR